MMIRNIHTAAILLTLAIVSATTENLRGNNNNYNNKKKNNYNDKQPDEQERSLMNIDMNVGLGEMVCKERVPVDGSVVCTFRTIPPKDLVTNYVHHDCLNAGGSNFCLGIEVYRMRYTDIPDAAFQPNPPSPIQQLPQQQQQQQVTVGSVGKCPSLPQATGMACAQYVPVGATDISCYFGRTKCDCALHNAVTEGWSCGLMLETPPATEVVVTKPVTNPITVTPPLQNIDANIQNVVVPSPTPQPVRFDTILPNIINREDCPAIKPVEGSDCEWGQQCMYYIEQNDVIVDIVSCDCDWSCSFVCRRPDPSVLGSF